MGVLSRRTVQMVGVVCLVYPLAFLSGYIFRSNKNILHGAPLMKDRELTAQKLSLERTTQGQKAQLLQHYKETETVGKKLETYKEKLRVDAQVEEQAPSTTAQLPKQKNRTQSGTSEGTTGSEPSTSFEFLNAGLCPLQGCNITREIQEVWSHYADAAKEARSDPLNEFATVEMARDGGQKFRMLTRDPKKDKFISASIRGGRLWDPMVRKPLIQAIKGQQSMPVFIDIGANVGYFTHTALAMGARVISFEPMCVL